MKILGIRINQKGETNFAFILVGIALTIGVIYALNHYHNRNNDITIHIPKVEVH